MPCRSLSTSFERHDRDFTMDADLTGPTVPINRLHTTNGHKDNLIIIALDIIYIYILSEVCHRAGNTLVCVTI